MSCISGLPKLRGTANELYALYTRLRGFWDFGFSCPAVGQGSVADFCEI